MRLSYLLPGDRPSQLALALFVFWGLFEFVIGRTHRTRDPAARRADSGSLGFLILLIWVGIFVGIGLARSGVAPLGLSPEWRMPVAIVLMVGGLVLRVFAISKLARLFTVDVAIQPGHKLVTDGVYSMLRHPSYTGVLLVLTGFALSLDDGLGSLVLFGLPALGLARRIQVEEAVLAANFGAEWESYRRRSWRLVPFVY